MTVKDKYLKDLYEDLKYSVSKFDEQSLLISGGALGLSLTFIKDIVPFQDSQYILIFYSALCLFIFSMGLGFIGHYLSTKYIMKSIEFVEQEKYSEIKPEKWIPRINTIIAIFLTLGVIFLVAYCIINIEIAKTKNKKDTKDSSSFIIKRNNASGNSLEIEGNVKTFKMTDTSNSKTTINVK